MNVKLTAALLMAGDQTKIPPGRCISNRVILCRTLGRFTRIESPRVWWRL